MKDLPAHARRSLTWDQGSEMALHAEIAQALEMPVYFCQKASPWQRPSNENTNGLLRQYFPKGTDLRRHDAEQLAAVADELNTRPRKTLSWQTPAARLANVTTGTRPVPARATSRRGARLGRVPGTANSGSA
jgi:IS30 family transposase